MSKKKEISRRTFLATAAAGGAACAIIPSRVLGRGVPPPRDTLPPKPPPTILPGWVRRRSCCPTGRSRSRSPTS